MLIFKFLEYFSAEQLGKLNDLVVTKKYIEIYQKSKTEDHEDLSVFSSSLNRFFSVKQYEQCLRVINEQEKLKSFSQNFLFKDNILDFEVDSQSLLPSNTHAIIGKNGVGKSYFLESIVSSFTPNTFQNLPKIEHPNFNKKDFSRLIYISTSIFGNIYAVPKDVETKQSIYYVGYNKVEDEDGDEVEIKDKPISISSQKEIVGNVVESFIGCISLGKIELLSQIFNLLSLDSEFEKLLNEIKNKLKTNDFNQLIFDKEKTEILERVFIGLSSGHFSIIYIVCSLIKLVSENSLVLIDEPENHLHPTLLANLIRTINLILQEKNALGIIATHSPIVLQEIPTNCVWKISSDTAERLIMNTFGESVGNLTRDVFSLSIEKCGFNYFIQNTPEEKLKKIEDSLGSEALFKYYRGKKNV